MLKFPQRKQNKTENPSRVLITPSVILFFPKHFSLITSFWKLGHFQLASSATWVGPMAGCTQDRGSTQHRAHSAAPPLLPEELTTRHVTASRHNPVDSTLKRQFQKTLSKFGLTPYHGKVVHSNVSIHWILCVWVFFPALSGRSRPVHNIFAILSFLPIMY